MLEQQDKGGFNSYRTLRPPFQPARPIQRFPPATPAVEFTPVAPTPPTAPTPPPAKDNFMPLVPELPLPKLPLPSPQPASNDFGKELTNLARMYTDEEQIHWSKR